jgi:nucleotide-binding universal stress UspA family protein
MFEHILVPLDGSSLAECVLPHVLSIAQAFSARVTLLTVLDQAPYRNSFKVLDPIDWTFRKAEAETYLYEVCARLSTEGLQISTSITEGQAADGIIRYAHEHQASLIVLSSHGRSGLSGWNISSVVHKVLLRAYTSMLIIPAYQPIYMNLGEFRYQKVFVALDGSMRAEWVLPVALKLISYQPAKLVLTHVVPKPEMPSSLPLTNEEVDIVNRFVEHNLRESEKYLKQLCSRLHAGLSDIQNDLVACENPIDALHDLVEQENVDLLILSAHGYSGGSRRPYGSVTMSFIAYGTTPLLILQDLSPEREVLTRVEMIVKERQGH